MDTQAVMMKKTIATHSEVREIHVIFKTHLDLGFTDYARNVKSRYFSEFFPRAVRLARDLRQGGGTERFIWTVGSWLIYQYLEEKTGTRRKLLEQAIADGDIVWHGLPFTTHTELMDASLLRHGLGFSRKLDRRFGRKTVAAKMTDVPGHTQAMVPLLAEAGIRFLHIGVNPASKAPDVPPVFVWRRGSSDLIVMYHKGTYGDLMVPAGLDAGIYFAHAGDNHGPQTKDEVLAVFDKLRRQFPSAKIMASTLNAFARKLQTVEASLPVVEDEIGDTWIHGVGTDPAKVRTFREFCRIRNRWLAARWAKRYRGAIDRFSDQLVLIPEHTWGMDEKTHLADYEHYSRRELAKLRRQKSTQRFEASWAEQRDYLVQAARSVKGTPLAAEVKQAVRTLTPKVSGGKGFALVHEKSRMFETERFNLRFDSSTGAINWLESRQTGRVWADARHGLGLFTYEIFSAADYNRFVRQYLQNLSQTRDWAIPDFTKPGIEKLKYLHGTWHPTLRSLLYRHDNARHEFLLKLEMPDRPVDQFGCPKTLTMELSINDETNEIALRLQTFEKNACRLPEAMWFSFCPTSRPDGTWMLGKLGDSISPLRVVRDGNRKLHAVSEGVCYADATATLAIDAIDAALVAPGERSLLDFNNRQPNVSKGMHFNLYNNVWGTNFPMWCEDDMLFRFVLCF